MYWRWDGMAQSVWWLGLVWQGQQNFLFCWTSSPSLWLDKPHIQSVLGIPFLGWSGLDMKLTTHPHLVPRVRINGAIPLLFLWACMLCIGTTFIFFKTKYHLKNPSVCTRGGDKSLARPGRKQATATKLGIYSTYSPRSSIHFLAHCCNFCKPPKKKKDQKVVRPTRSPPQCLLHVQVIVLQILN